MEIPPELKTLYSHWDKHTQHNPQKSINDTSVDPDLWMNMAKFASERMNIWQQKITNQPQPYTADPILQNYRFCNIYRELDKQTIQIHRSISSLKDNFELWLLNLCFQRFVCRPDTIDAVGALSFDEVENRRVMGRLQNHLRPKYGTAYVFPISAIQRSNYPTREEFFCLYLPKITTEVAQVITDFRNETVNSALGKILPVFGYNFRFHWTEILIDVAYQFPEKINLFLDFHIGPGAMPTIQKLSKHEDENTVLNALPQIKLRDFPYLTFNGKQVWLSAENWEGISCEYRKYTNLLNGSGRKRKY